MDKQILKGTITFIHHEKNYASIAYELNGKKKSVNGNISEKEQERLREKKLIKKTHRFHIGDEVSFLLVPSAKGDKLVADCIEFLFNNAYTNLIQKAATENRFAGYLKKAGEQWLVKETGSYILFPLTLSPWELPPHESRLNEPVFFKLDNLEKPGAVSASLYKSEFIPEYLKAVKHHKNQTPVSAIVNKVSPYGIFISCFNNKLQAKIAVGKGKQGATIPSLKVGDVVEVSITYISPQKLVVDFATDV